MATSPPKTPTVQKRVTSFSASNTGQYNINQLCYPSNISTDPDMQHYVMFFVNVRGKSKFKAQNNSRVLGVVTKAGENRVDSTNLNMATGLAVGAATGAVAGLGIGKTVMQGGYARTAGKLGVLAGATVGLAAGGVGIAATTALGATIGAAAGNLLVETDTTYRISDAIMLHVSAAPQTQYSTSYDDVELGALIGGASSALSASDSARMSMLPEAARAVMQKAAGGIGNVLTAGKLNNIISSNTISNAAALASKQNLNPFKEVLFQSVGFRKFTFNYSFYPKSQAESDNVYNIIKTFKYHMHPELSKGGLYMIHPSEFNIQYFFNGKENTYFNKISTCVLEDVHVDYGGESFSSFRDGSPTEITMRLTFREIETLTKDRIEEGF